MTNYDNVKIMNFVTSCHLLDEAFIFINNFIWKCPFHFRFAPTIEVLILSYDICQDVL